MIKILDLLFGCSHKRHTLPMTIRKRGSQSVGAEATAGMMHVTCLGCGKEFLYDWQQMKIIYTPKQIREFGCEVTHADPSG